MMFKKIDNYIKDELNKEKDNNQLKKNQKNA